MLKNTALNCTATVHYFKHKTNSRLAHADNVNNTADNKKRKKDEKQTNTAHLSSLPPTLLRLTFVPFSPEMSQTKQQT